jgi:hypothetical protein
MSIPLNTPITLPLFERVLLNVPDYFVLPSKKQGQFKLVKGLTPSGKNFTTRQGHKAVKIKSNEKNELYLEEPNYNNPRIEYGMFSPKDQTILKKYFKPVQKEDEQSVVSSIGNLTPKYHYEYKAGKKYRVLDDVLQNDIIYEAGQTKKRRRMKKTQIGKGMEDDPYWFQSYY